MIDMQPNDDEEQPNSKIFNRQDSVSSKKLISQPKVHA